MSHSSCKQSLYSHNCVVFKRSNDVNLHLFFLQFIVKTVVIEHEHQSREMNFIHGVFAHTLMMGLV